jgi:MFS family permease
MRLARPVANALRLSILEGSLFGVYWNIITVIVVNGLAVVLHADPFQFAVLNSIPLLCQIFGLPAANIIQSRDVRKPLTLWAEGFSRNMWLLLLILFFFPMSNDQKIWFIIAVTALSNITHSWGVLGWLSWVSDLVPEQIRGMYFGVRGAICGFVGLIGLTIASTYADKFKTLFEGWSGLQQSTNVVIPITDVIRNLIYSEADYMNVIIVLILISVFFAMASQAGLFFQPVRRMKNLSTTGWKNIWETLNEPNARKIAITWVGIYIAAGITSGMYMQFFINKLHMSWMGITAYIWVVNAMSTAITPVMGRLSDKFGNRNVLMYAWLGVFWQPLLSVFTPNDMPHIFGWMPITIFIDALACGIFWPAVNLTLTNLVIAQAPSEKRAGLFGVLTGMGGLAGFIFAASAGKISELIGDTATFSWVGIRLDDIRVMLLAGAIARVFAGMLILAIKEPPRQKDPVAGSEAILFITRLLIGKPIDRLRF